jgi:hypothetical protein
MWLAKKVHPPQFLLHLLKAGGYMKGQGLKLKNPMFCLQSANIALYFVKRAQPTCTSFTEETRTWLSFIYYKQFDR